MPDTAARIALICEDDQKKDQAELLAARLAIPVLAEKDNCDFLLAVTGDRLELRQSGARTPGPVFVDFTSGTLRYRRQFGGGRKEALARAVGLKANRCPSVLDATAGLGRDSFILASLGCRVLLVERSAIIAALLEDGLARTVRDPELAAIVARMQIIHADCLTLDHLAPSPDVIYLDPMYPHRSKSALVKKEMRLVRALVGDDSDASQLLDWALGQKVARVVVKRPQGAPTLDDRKPAFVINGKNSRFDIYLPR
ncbi:MAG: class I SAM-dependent methyltransferase [Proteobacteria bacterium]|nr:class I SAM-dependent methyltransferase [Pseudomonadota bacterium]MBU4295235.1 class I SAM-dependent methyltransferase [Pseudomonadota bacterium]MCG2750169.1 class I SAM-dependent methyltransferase [Desulfobulbaceae bacterium]